MGIALAEWLSVEAQRWRFASCGLQVCGRVTCLRGSVLGRAVFFRAGFLRCRARACVAWPLCYAFRPPFRKYRQIAALAYISPF